LDGYEEALDMAVYLRQALEEGWHPKHDDVWAQYLAGLLDGEGWFGARKTSPGRHWVSPCISIGLTTPEVLHWLVEVTGVGHVYGPKRERRLDRSPFFQWQVVRRKDIVLILDAVTPYLKVKRAQAMALRIVCVAGRKFGEMEDRAVSLLNKCRKAKI
jgi:hypothetical protein